MNTIPPPVAMLLPRHRIALSCAINREDVPKFVDAWRAVWPRLPLWARREILRYWRTAKGSDFDVRRQIGYCPAIHVLPLPIAAGDAFAVVLENGARVCFNPDAVRDMPAAVLECLIAHELVHVVRKAKGWEDSEAYHQDALAYLEEEESVAYDMDAWGFDDDSIDVWAAENRDKLPWLADLKKNVDPDRHPAKRDADELAAILSQGGK